MGITDLVRFEVGQRVVIVNPDLTFETGVLLGYRKEKFPIYSGSGRRRKFLYSVEHEVPSAFLQVALVNLQATIVAINPMRSYHPLTIEFDFPLRPEPTTVHALYRRMNVTTDDVLPVLEAEWAAFDALFPRQHIPPEETV